MSMLTLKAYRSNRLEPSRVILYTRLSVATLVFRSHTLYGKYRIHVINDNTLLMSFWGLINSHIHGFIEELMS